MRKPPTKTDYWVIGLLLLVVLALGFI